jgi:hypothetical protein
MEKKTMKNRKQRNQYGEITIWPKHINQLGDDDSTDYPETSARRYTCGSVTNSCLRWTIGILAFIAALSILPVVLVAYLSTDDVVANQRYYVNAPSANGVGFVTGQLQLNTNTRQISWDLLTVNMTLPLQSIGIYGPIDIDTPTGPFVLALCGPPSSLVCTFTGVIGQTNPGGLSLSGFINEIRSRPFAYYYNITTADFPMLDARGPLGISSGRP